MLTPLRTMTMITAIQNMNGIPCGQWAVGVCLEIIHVTPHCLSNTATRCKTSLAKSPFFLSLSSYLVCKHSFEIIQSTPLSSLFLQALLSSSSALYFFVCQMLWRALREGTPACIFFLCLLTLHNYALASTAIIVNTLLVVFFKEFCVREHLNTNLHIRPQALLGRPPSNWYWHFFG